ncbi:MAG: ATP-binding protein, partial [Desulfurococcaceae archaeon]
MNEIEEIESEIQCVVQEIGLLREKVKEYKTQRQKLITELREIAERKHELLEKIRTLKQKLRDFNDKRKKIIEELRSLVSERKGKLEELKTLRELITEKKLVIQEMSKGSKTPVTIIKDEIEKLEWKIQTSVLSLEEENKILRKIKTLVSLLEKAEKLQREKNDVLELRALYTSISLQVRDLNVKINKLRNELDNLTRGRDRIKEELKKLVS